MLSNFDKGIPKNFRFIPFSCLGRALGQVNFFRFQKKKLLELDMTKMNPWDLVPLHLVPISSSLGAQRGPKFQVMQTAFSPPKNDRIQKIRPLFTIKLFEDEEWKWSYFLDWVIFWWWKCCLYCLKFGPTLGPEGARDWNQMKQDQVSGVHFDHI